MNTRQISKILGLLVIFALGVLVFAPASTTLAQGRSGTTLSAYKTAEGYWERRIDWEICKSAHPTELYLECNQSHVVDYTVSVEKMVTDVYGVRGRICVTNGGDRATEGLKIVGQVEYKTGAGKFKPLEGASWTYSPPQQLGPGESACYEYNITFEPRPNAQYRNSVKVTITNHSGHLGQDFGPNPKASFSLPSQPRREGYETVHVTDTNGYEWTFNDSGSQMYEKTFTCPADEGSHTNTATIVETGQYAEATVTVNCMPCPPPPMTQWCSPGFWRNNFGAWGPTGISPDEYYNDFASYWMDGGELSYCPDSLDGNPTLWEVLSSPKDYAHTGAFECVADLLSWEHPDVNFEPNCRPEDTCPLPADEGNK